MIPWLLGAELMSTTGKPLSTLDATVDRTDGISFDFAGWRLNLRSSNTEPLRRLNVESRGNAALVADQVREIEMLVRVTC